jgi:hypothetical protein
MSEIGRLGIETGQYRFALWASRSIGGHFGASGSPGQYFDLVEIQSLASASVSKSPIWESGPFPVFTATNQRPPFIISGSKRGKVFGMPLIYSQFSTIPSRITG